MATENRRVGKIRPGDVVPAAPRTVSRTIFEQGGGVTIEFTEGAPMSFADVTDAIEVIVDPTLPAS